MTPLNIVCPDSFQQLAFFFTNISLGTKASNKAKWGLIVPVVPNSWKVFKDLCYSTGKAASRSASCPRILLCGDDDSHTRHLGPALLHTLEHLPCHMLDVTTLFEETGRAAEEAIIQVTKHDRPCNAPGYFIQCYWLFHC